MAALKTPVSEALNTKTSRATSAPQSTFNTISLAKADEPTILDVCAKTWNQLMDEDPSLAIYLDDVDIEVCTESELIHAIRIAKSAEIRTGLWMKHQLRLQRATVSGRAF